MNAVTAIAEILKSEGIEYLATFPNTPLIEACAKVGIQPVVCRQERVGMGIADGFSRTTNGKRLGVFAMQHGPGTENAYPGAAQAYSDSVPLLLLPGGPSTDRAHHRREFDSVESFGSVTSWGARINKIERISELMRAAFYHLRSGQGGPRPAGGAVRHMEGRARRGDRVHARIRQPDGPRPGGHQGHRRRPPEGE